MNRRIVGVGSLHELRWRRAPVVAAFLTPRGGGALAAASGASGSQPASSQPGRVRLNGLPMPAGECAVSERPAGSDAAVRCLRFRSRAHAGRARRVRRGSRRRGDALRPVRLLVDVACDRSLRHAASRLLLLSNATVRRARTPVHNLAAADVREREHAVCARETTRGITTFGSDVPAVRRTRARWRARNLDTKDLGCGRHTTGGRSHRECDRKRTTRGARAA